MLEVNYLKDSRTEVKGEIHSIVVQKMSRLKPFYNFGNGMETIWITGMVPSVI